jgi:hypothetical protein
MRDHHLGHPKTPRSRRTITIAPAVAALLEKRIEGRPADDFVFTSRTGLPLHNGDFYTHIWRKLMTAVAAEGLSPFRFHDLRHTHVAWLIAGGAPLPHIQARLGHVSITTTIDTYGHLLPAGDELISRIIDTGAHRWHYPADVDAVTVYSLDRVRLRWIGITSDVTGCSPAATGSSRCSTRNRMCLPILVQRTLCCRTASATQRAGTLRYVAASSIVNSGSC